MAMFSKDGCVLTCTVTQCSYNKTEECHAPNIEVGEDHPACDTYTTQPVQDAKKEAMVAQCHVSECTFNNDQDCHARGITVAMHSGHADCYTYRPEM